MNVLYDHSIFENQKFGGISKYFIDLISELSKFEGFQYSIPISYSSNAYISRLKKIQLKGEADYYNKFMFGKEFRGKWFLYQAFEKHLRRNRINFQHSLEKLKSNDYDLFHPTDLDSYFLPFIGKKPYVITIHDMIDEIYPEYRFDVFTNYKNSTKCNIIKNATKVIAISDTTKDDILKIIDVEESKIHVVHHGSALFGNHNFDAKNLQKIGLPKNYILFVGKRVHYKNFYFFISSIVTVLNQNHELKVVCCGAPFNQKEKYFIEDLGLSDKIYSFQIKESELHFVYQNAQMFIYPSLYEGFGIPILEAFQNDCPVALSDIKVFKEVAGDAALYFDPKDSISIKETVSTIINDASGKTSEILKKKGKNRANQFSIKKMAEETRAVYDLALS